MNLDLKLQTARKVTEIEGILFDYQEDGQFIEAMNEDGSVGAGAQVLNLANLVPDIVSLCQRGISSTIHSSGRFKFTITIDAEPLEPVHNIAKCPFCPGGMISKDGDTYNCSTPESCLKPVIAEKDVRNHTQLTLAGGKFYYREGRLYCKVHRTKRTYRLIKPIGYLWVE